MPLLHSSHQPSPSSTKTSPTTRPPPPPPPSYPPDPLPAPQNGKETEDQAAPRIKGAGEVSNSTNTQQAQIVNQLRNLHSSTFTRMQKPASPGELLILAVTRSFNNDMNIYKYNVLKIFVLVIIYVL